MKTFQAFYTFLRLACIALLVLGMGGVMFGALQSALHWREWTEAAGLHTPEEIARVFWLTWGPAGVVALSVVWRILSHAWKLSKRKRLGMVERKALVLRRRDTDIDTYVR